MLCTVRRDIRNRYALLHGYDCITLSVTHILFCHGAFIVQPRRNETIAALEATDFTQSNPRRGIEIRGASRP